MTDAELMMGLFRGSDLAHGRTDLTANVSAKGKVETKCWMERRPATLDDWQRHLTGVSGLGIPPIDSRNLVHWGAIDVDVYVGLSLDKVNRTIQEAKLPLVMCRSKSGGPHIYLFLKNPHPAKDMIEKLGAIASFLGFGTSEIFPKQVAIVTGGKGQDFGSWINMPYFGGTRFLRYALNENGEAITTVADFVAYAEKRQLSDADFAALTPPEKPETFPGGPPCLNRIFETAPSENRNVLLANVAVYAKKAQPDTWREIVEAANRRFAEPLMPHEVDALKKSYEKKDYRYQCRIQPLCAHCDSSRCRKVQHGVGGGELTAVSKSLTKLETSPVIWFMDMAKSDGEMARISLTTEELQNPRLFQRRCMESLNQMPPIMKTDEWRDMIADLIKNPRIVSIPEEMKPEGMFRELVRDFLTARAASESWEDMLRGKPYCNNEAYHFRMRDLTSYIRDQRFNALKLHEMNSILHESLGARRGFKVIAGKGTNYISIPLESKKDHEPEPTVLPAPTFAGGY